MKHTITQDPAGQGFILAFEGEDVEMVNPVSYYSDWFMRRNMAVTKAMLQAKNPVMESYVSEEFYQKRAVNSWLEVRKRIAEATIPPGLITLLYAASKREQEKALRGVGFNYLEFAAFLFKAYETYDYSFSNYIAEQLPKNIDTNEMPLFVNVKDGGSVKKIGETNLTDGQLRSAVQFRRVVVAKFLDRGDEWHCFFTVYRSLRGEEAWQDGQPHFHYISDKWGHTREAVVAMFKGDRYPTTSVHIVYNEH